MNTISTGLAVLGLAALGWMMPAQAQGLPPGSYLNSCTGAHVEGDTLIARCRATDGREMHSALAGVHRCVGDIGNSDGSLRCNFGRAEAAPVGPRERYAEDREAQCRGLHHEAEELHARLDHELNPIERARIEDHLRELHERQERC